MRTPGIMLFDDGAPSSLLGVDVAAGKIVAIHSLREPTKLAAALARLPPGTGEPVSLGVRSADGRYTVPEGLDE
jgi:hypothetical protein